MKVRYIVWSKFWWGRHKIVHQFSVKDASVTQHSELLSYFVAKDFICDFEFLE